MTRYRFAYLPLILAGAGLIARTLQAAEPVPPLLGAEKMITLLEQTTSKSNAPSQKDTKEEQLAALAKALTAFSEKSDTLPPKEAAQQWLALYDRFAVLSTNRPPRDYSSYRFRRQNMKNATDLKAFITALPGPTAWPDLAELAAKRPAPKDNKDRHDIMLRLLASILARHAGDFQKNADAAAQLFKSRDEYTYSNTQPIDELREAGDLFFEGNNGEQIVPAFEKLIAKLQKNPVPFTQIKVPDLVALAGPEKARELIKNALVIPGVVLAVPYGKAMLQLAQQTALDQIEKISTPQWQLACSLDATGLYEAMDKKFTSQKKEPVSAAMKLFTRGSDVFEYTSFNNERGEAPGYYIMGLLAHNRADDAIKALLAMDKQTMHDYSWSDPLDKAANAIPGNTLLAFFEKILMENPELPFWEQYTAIAGQMGKTAQVADLFKKAVENPALDAPKRQHLRRQLVELYLADDRIDEAVALARALLKEPEDGSREARRDSRQGLALKLAELGRVLERPDIRDEGLAAALQDTETKLQDIKDRSFPTIDTLCDGLISAGRPADAERLLQSMLAAYIREFEKKGAGPSEYTRIQYSGKALALLASLYGNQGRPADVLLLAERAPWWGCKDVRTIMEYRFCGDLPSIGHTLAQSLDALGRPAEAARILKAELLQNPADDDDFGLLCRIEGANLIPWLDKMYTCDRFEERPLIWKAVLQQRAGELDAAETTIRTALKVDPTDGEQKAGDRVRAYAVLADILAAHGKSADAAFFSNVVQAVRIAEHGDKLTRAGLIRRSLAEYEKASMLFSDAYCVQWRLAERLRVLGRVEEAEKHYQTAFERMPEQFGQVASLCFGCEGIFNNDTSRSMAENVLLRLEAAGKPRPPVYYLLGQLRRSQERLPEAYAYFKKALELDPGYLDVMEQIYEISQEINIPTAEYNALALKMLALDPLQRHAGVDIEKITDLAGLWETVKKNQPFVIPMPESVWPLPASSAMIEKAEKEKAARSSGDDYDYETYFNNRRAPLSAGAALIQCEVIKQLLQLDEHLTMMAD